MKLNYAGLVWFGSVFIKFITHFSEWITYTSINSRCLVDTQCPKAKYSRPMCDVAHKSKFLRLLLFLYSKRII